MTKNWQKRPRLVEAYQIHYDRPIPPEVIDQILLLPDRGYFASCADGQYRYIHDTDWVIREADGVHIYPVSDAIFYAMYYHYNGG